MTALRSLFRSGRKFLRESRAKVLRRAGLLNGDWQGALPAEVQFWEMALRDGGRNWDPEEFRRRMDGTRELQGELKALLDAPPGARVRILDVGAGPLTTLGKRWEGRQLEIVAVDPLAAEYARLLARLGLVPPVTTTSAHGEKLLDRFAVDEFDLAYASNALDHSYDPRLAIRQMLTVVKPGRHVYLWHFANEGTAESYHGLHQWNFDIQGNDFMISDGRSRHSLAAEFAGRARLACERQVAFGKQVVIAQLQKIVPG